MKIPQSKLESESELGLDEKDFEEFKVVEEIYIEKKEQIDNKLPDSKITESGKIKFFFDCIKNGDLKGLTYAIEVYGVDKNEPRNVYPFPSGLNVALSCPKVNPEIINYLLEQGALSFNLYELSGKYGNKKELSSNWAEVYTAKKENKKLFDKLAKIYFYTVQELVNSGVNDLNLSIINFIEKTNSHFKSYFNDLELKLFTERLFFDSLSKFNFNLCNSLQEKYNIELSGDWLTSFCIEYEKILKSKSSKKDIDTDNLFNFLNKNKRNISSNGVNFLYTLALNNDDLFLLKKIIFDLKIKPKNWCLFYENKYNFSYKDENIKNLKPGSKDVKNHYSECFRDDIVKEVPILIFAADIGNNDCFNFLKLHSKIINSTNNHLKAELLSSKKASTLIELKNLGININVKTTLGNNFLFFWIKKDGIFPRSGWQLLYKMAPEILLEKNNSGKSPMIIQTDLLRNNKYYPDALSNFEKSLSKIESIVLRKLSNEVKKKSVKTRAPQKRL